LDYEKMHHHFVIIICPMRVQLRADYGFKKQDKIVY